MTNSPASPESPPRFSAAVMRGLREGGAISLGVVALVVVVALLSFDARDPGFSSTGVGDAIHNRVGSAGAWLADLLYFLFGRPAYLLPLALGVAARAHGARRARRPEPSSRANFAVRGLGFALLLMSSCALTALHWNPGALPAGAGGMVGSAVGSGLAGGLNLLGATLLLLAVVGGQRRGRLRHFVAARHRRPRRGGVARASATCASAGTRRARSTTGASASRRAWTRARPRTRSCARGRRRASRRRRRRWPRASAPRRSARCRCSIRRRPASCRRWACWMIRATREPSYSAEALEAMSRLVELKLKDFGVEVEVVAVHPGPVITRFEMRPAPGVKASQITALAKDLARSLSTTSVRVVEVIPGKSVMGLEIPNEKREVVTLGEIIKSKAYDDVASPLALALGKDIGGAPMVADLARMPHLLIAGTTGSGKSVALNAMVLSLLYKSTAEHVRLIMIDPKMLELSVYEGIPHLLAPVVTDMKQAANALRWCVAEMERRYQLMSALGVRNISGYNRHVKDATAAGKPIRDPILMMRAANDPSHRPAADPRARAAALRRGDHRRARRPDDDGGQEGRGTDRAPGAEGARLRHPPDPGDAAALGRCDHRPDQGQHPDAHRLPGLGARWIRARSWTRWAPNRCWATATCCTCRPARRYRRACTAPSSATRKCTAWSMRSGRARRRPTSRRCWRGPRSRWLGISGEEDEIGGSSR